MQCRNFIVGNIKNVIQKGSVVDLIGEGYSSVELWEGQEVFYINNHGWLYNEIFKRYDEEKQMLIFENTGFDFRKIIFIGTF